jgi:phosphoenolpyruvate synthase/pyruvate phosphate dikinase
MGLQLLGTAPDPFQTIDVKGIGQLVKWAIEGGKKIRLTLKVGVCGEHGGVRGRWPSSIQRGWTM